MPNEEGLYSRQPDGTWALNTQLAGSNVEAVVGQTSPAKAVLIGGIKPGGTNAIEVPSVSTSASDGLGTADPRMFVLSASSAYSDSTSRWERQRNNTQGTLLASAARTATISSPDQINYNARGIHVMLDVTTAGTGSITLSIEEKDPVSGKYVPILTGAAVTVNGTTVYKVYPGLTAAANSIANDILPRTFRVTATHNNANSVTYSVGFALVL